MIDKEWTLFLDRDGVINEQIIGGYVQSQSQFMLKDKVMEALVILRSLFGKIIIVTNQQGIGKGICSENDVEKVHQYMLKLFADNHTPIDQVYYCPHLASEGCSCRKPKTGMAQQAQRDFPEIDFHRSIMVGDSLSDILFGKNCGMLTAYIGPNPDTPTVKEEIELANFRCIDLYNFAKLIQ